MSWGYHCRLLAILLVVSALQVILVLLAVVLLLAVAADALRVWRKRWLRRQIKASTGNKIKDEEQFSCGVYARLRRRPGQHLVTDCLSFRCSNCDGSLLRHTLENPRSVMSKTKWYGKHAHCSQFISPTPSPFTASFIACLLSGCNCILLQGRPKLLALISVTIDIGGQCSSPLKK